MSLQECRSRKLEPSHAGVTQDYCRETRADNKLVPAYRHGDPHTRQQQWTMCGGADRQASAN